MTRIAFLGIGLMGAPMARNLVAAGYDVTVWNRSVAKAQTITGATIAKTAASAVKAADVIISILSDGDATAQVLADADLRSHLSKAQIWIDMASTKPAQARAQAIDLAQFGTQHLDAPVSGGTTGAQNGTLAIMVGGDADVFAKSTPVLSTLGTPVHVGPTGCGQLAKLANQGIVGITIGAVAEAMLLLERGGADPVAVRQALQGGFADSTILQLHGARMTDDDLTARARASTQLKDMNNIQAEADALQLTLPMSSNIRDRFAYLVETMDHGDLDHAALYLELLARNQSS